MTSKETRRNPLSMANSSQRLALSANKNKNWRANYLRALNIFTPDLQTSTRGRHVSSEGRRAERRRPEEPRRRPEEPRREEPKPPSTRASSSNSARSSRSGSSTRSHNQEKASTYVFGMRQHLFRARRPPRSDFMTVDHVSAPIEIPTGTSVTSPTEIPSRADKLDRNSMQRRRGSSNDFQGSTDKQPMMQLLSWEEPSVMLGSGGWPLESEKRDELGRRSRPYAGIAEEYEDTEDDEPTTTENDDDDDIFKMEFDGEGSGSNAGKNVFRGTRSKDRRRAELQRRRPEGLDDLDDDEESDAVTPLSASFVPPHQMVERGCFSLGLRDELKRKPGVHM